MKMNESEVEDKSKEVNQKKSVLQKSKLIELLEQKNAVLFKEVQRITKIVEEYQKKVTQKPNSSIIKSVLLTTTNDPDILSKQLNNCYKQIKIYEYQVQKLKSRTLSVQVSDKMMTIDRQLKQKKTIQDRLKQQLNTLMKEISDYSKKLSGNNHQLEVQKQYKAKIDELRFLKEMIKDYETKQSIKQKNLKQQYMHIKTMEKQFMDNGGSVGDLQTVKRKALSQFQQGRLVKRQTQKQSQDIKITMVKNQSIVNNSSIQNYTNSNPSNQMQSNRSKTNYENMLNEINVLEKLNKKYEKQFEQSDKVINELQGKTQLKKLRLYKLQKQIQEMNGSIKLQKTFIVAENMKPAHRKLSVRSVNVRQDVVNVSQARGVNKRKRNIINMTSIMSDRQQRLFHN